MAGLVRAWRRMFPTVTDLLRPPALEDLHLYDMSKKAAIKEWYTATDKPAGGRSACTVDWHDAEGGFMRFSGTVSGVMGRTMARSGFCATRSPKRWRGVDLTEYEGLALKVRTDGRHYAVNIEPQTYFDTDLYQGYIIAPAGLWTVVTLPFDGLMHTSRGRVVDESRPLDAVHLLSLGFSIFKEIDKGREGPFQLDVQWVRARQRVENSRAGRERLQRAKLIDPRSRTAEQEELVAKGTTVVDPPIDTSRDLPRQ